MSVEIRPDNSTKQWTKTVFIDGEQLRLQCPEDPQVIDGLCIVRCLGMSVANPLDPDAVPYQAKRYTINTETEGINNGVEIITFYLLYTP